MERPTSRTANARSSWSGARPRGCPFSYRNWTALGGTSHCSTQNLMSTAGLSV